MTIHVNVSWVVVNLCFCMVYVLLPIFLHRYILPTKFLHFFRIYFEVLLNAYKLVWVKMDWKFVNNIYKLVISLNCEIQFFQIKFLIRIIRIKCNSFRTINVILFLKIMLKFIIAVSYQLICAWAWYFPGFHEFLLPRDYNVFISTVFWNFMHQYKCITRHTIQYIRIFQVTLILMLPSNQSNA